MLQPIAVEGVTGLIQCGREITPADIAMIVELREMYPTLSYSGFVGTVCEVLGWLAASGEPKTEACTKLLEKLEAAGIVVLPTKESRKVPYKRKRSTRPLWGPQTEPGDPVEGELSEIGPIRVEPATKKASISLWNEYVDRYHKLGYKKPFGCRMRYFIESDHGKLGCLLIAGAAKSIGVRDRWIGWSDQVRLQNLGWVANNSRFVIFPWVKVRNLASHALGQLVRRMSDDYQRKWSFRPLLVETFVDPEHYRGSCYRGAGWQLLGSTTGEGLVRPGKTYSTSPKLIFVKPVPPFSVDDAKHLLCRPELVAWTERMRGRI